MARAIMFQGTGSNVGKSLLVAGLCRAFRARGLAVRPFKPQNMSNNAAVTVDGGEIGRAQALQARAAGIAPVSDLNPVLLKPETETGAQVVLQGRRLTTVKARDYAALKPTLLGAVTESFERLRDGADLLLVEGAGSPAETNLRAGDIANMGFAEAANLPVILTGDIDRGGVIAQLVGTHSVLDGADRARIRGFIVNKFRGDRALFDPALGDIAARTGWRSLGLVPWFDAARDLPAEDAFDIRSAPGEGIRVAVPRLSRIANFDDLDPLAMEPSVNLEMIEPGQPLPGNADLVLIPGSKSTIADLAYFRAQGWDIDLAAHIRRGGHVLGICGGYQMLGREIDDPLGLEGAPGAAPGLGHLDVVTRMQPEKHLSLVEAEYLDSGARLEGYEIHIGETTGPDTARPWLGIGARREGARSADGRVMGCYLHGIFASDAFRRTFLEHLGGYRDTGTQYGARVEQALDLLAGHLEENVDLDQLYDLAAPPH